MSLAIEKEVVPLYLDESGTARVGNTRITLDLLIAAFLDGDSPEEITEQFSTLNLADVYVVLGFYLRHRNSVDEYLSERKQEAEEIRARVENKHDRANLRRRLLARQGR